ncbi:hypothetical protein M404DRAFT_389039 [Pisolithus tinctorius Marx 270]|uniref:Uncharacterized protein n=1 Tax=Pisolithus tinctorius Marx 270 TaxID=870435 RepID=A0A0C3KD75_PISTI|nr:hypothetical protein M404DRAFT_389039 [Pisolithus tinctorius Marx 270]
MRSQCSHPSSPSCINHISTLPVTAKIREGIPGQKITSSRSHLINRNKYHDDNEPYASPEANKQRKGIVSSVITLRKRHDINHTTKVRSLQDEERGTNATQNGQYRKDKAS